MQWNAMTWVFILATSLSLRRFFNYETCSVFCLTDSSRTWALRNSRFILITACRSGIWEGLSWWFTLGLLLPWWSGVSSLAWLAADASWWHYAWLRLFTAVPACSLDSTVVSGHWASYMEAGLPRPRVSRKPRGSCLNLGSHSASPGLPRWLRR